MFFPVLPYGNLYCRQCTCQIHSDGVDKKEALLPLGTLKFSQGCNQYHEACVEECGWKIDMASGSWYSCFTCQEVYLGLQGQSGIMDLLHDGARGQTRLTQRPGTNCSLTTKVMIQLPVELHPVRSFRKIWTTSWQTGAFKKPISEIKLGDADRKKNAKQDLGR